MSISPLEAGILLVLVGWFAISVVNQAEFAWLQWVRARDAAGILPEWKFFRRDSGQWDFHLLYRDRDREGNVTAWTAVPTTEPRAPYHVIWNPEKRSTKVLTDIASALAGSPWRDQQAVMLTIPYLLLLHAVSRFPAAAKCVERQFMVVRIPGGSAEKQPQVLFRSLFHALQ